MTLALQLFGPPAWLHDGVAEALAVERRTQLLVHLALTQGAVGRAELAALLWPDQQPKQAHANLRKTVFRLAAMPWGQAVAAQGTALRLELAHDVAAFDAAVAAEQYAEAVALYRGPLLQGFDDDANEAWTRWLHFERERRQVAWRAAALSLVQGAMDDGVAIELATRLLQADALDEAAASVLVQRLAASGQQARAQREAAAFGDRLQAELGVAPSVRFQTLVAFAGLHGVQAIKRDAQAKHHGQAEAMSQQVPATSALVDAAVAAGRGGEASFIGRAAELRHLRTLLDDVGCRLLTVVGAGGSGKTRLVRQLLATQGAPGARWALGGVWVPLEDVNGAAALLNRLAERLGVRLSGGQPPREQIVSALGEGARLLVLDNFEQLLSCAEELEALLAGCARLQIVVTSRIRLATSSEWLLPLGGLPAPEPEDVEAFEAFDAVRLFLQAARRVEPRLQATREAAAIVEICQRVEGLPLALELVASWLRVLSCADIAAELARGGELLRTADPTRPARQASLEVVFDHSWQQLGEAERAALARLTVFRGGCGVEAARQVAGASPAVLAALVDRSLLRREGARYTLHPLVQQLAGERLGADAASCADAHSRHYLLMLQRHRLAARRAERAVLLELNTEFDNLGVAWREAARRPLANALMAAAPTLMDYCDHRGRWLEGLALFQAALDEPAVQAQRLLQAALQCRAAHLCHRLDRYRQAEQLAQQAMVVARACHDEAMQIQCWKVLGANHLRAGEIAQARKSYEHILRLARTAGEALVQAAALSNLALIATRENQGERAQALYHEALLRQREEGDVAGEAMGLNNLGVLLLRRGDLAAARDALRAGNVLCERHGLPTTQSLILNNLADLAWRESDVATAAHVAEQALTISQAAGQRAASVIARQILLRTAIAQGQLELAREHLAAALQMAIAIARVDLMAGGAYLFAELLAAQGEQEAACQVRAFAAAHPTMDDADRAEARVHMRKWGLAEGVEPAWPGLELQQLVQRIVFEREQRHAPLLAVLREARGKR